MGGRPRVRTRVVALLCCSAPVLPLVEVCPSHLSGCLLMADVRPSACPTPLPRSCLLMGARVSLQAMFGSTVVMADCKVRADGAGEEGGERGDGKGSGDKGGSLVWVWGVACGVCGRVVISASIRAGVSVRADYVNRERAKRVFSKVDSLHRLEPML
jgi:hypothetical protein